MTMYTVDCDGCGANADEGTDYSCWPDHESAIEMAKYGGEPACFGAQAIERALARVGR